MPDEFAGDKPAKMLRLHGLQPRKRLGQNFLQDRSFLARILDAADIHSNDLVLEIGAGTGELTAAAAQRARLVTAIELDNALFELLTNRFRSSPGVSLWHGNALAFDPCVHLDGPYKLLGNIPYNITGAIIRRYLEVRCRPEILVLMVQREVAERMVATPGRLSLLGVSVQYYAEVTIIARVPAGAFHPRPNVESAIVRLGPYSTRPSADAAQQFFQVVKAGFSSPRKQIGNPLMAGLELSRLQVQVLLSSAGIDETRRAETLSIDEWKCLTAVRKEIDKERLT